MLDAARQAAAYRNEMDNNVQSESVRKMAAAGLKVNGVRDEKEFMKGLEAFKQGYVREKGQAWQALYGKVSAVK